MISGSVSDISVSCVQPKCDAGDVIAIIQQTEHELYRRSGVDLFVTRTISITEALCGVHVVLKQLDGRKLIIKTAPGDIIAPGMVSIVAKQILAT